jgi:hypothetical protein
MKLKVPEKPRGIASGKQPWPMAYTTSTAVPAAPGAVMMLLP